MKFLCKMENLFKCLQVANPLCSVDDQQFLDQILDGKTFTQFLHNDDYLSLHRNVDTLIRSWKVYHTIMYTNIQIANHWKTLQSKHFQSLFSPLGLVTPIKIVHHWKLCIILFLGKKWTFCRISVLSNASLGGFSVLLNHESPLVGSKGNAHWACLLSNFLLLFVIQQFHCQTFWFKWRGRFSSLFASFPSRPTHSRCLCLGLQEQTSKLTQSNATHILSRFSETHHHIHPHPSLVNTAPFPSCQWTLASLFSHWGFSHRFQKGCRRKMEESLW